MFARPTLASTFAAVSGGPTASLLIPTINVLLGLAGLVSAGFIIYGGITLITSSGKPDKMAHAKRVIRNALIGLVLVLGAATLTGILDHSFTQPDIGSSAPLPAIDGVDTTPQGGSLVDVLSSAIAGLLQNIVQSAGLPFVQALSHFTHATPLLSSNHTILTIWLAITGIADGLFLLIVILLGFHIMSAGALGLDEIEPRQLLPQLVVIFLLMNTSIFIIDGFINVSNIMIHAFEASLANTDVWTVLGSVIDKGSALSLTALLILTVFIIISVLLILYYIMRLVALYIGAALSPIVLLLWLVPAFKDFSVIIMRTYLVTIFILFVHVVILQIAASMLVGLGSDSAGTVLMSMFVGIGALLTILKTQTAVNHITYVSLGVRNARQLGRNFVSSASTLANQFNNSRNGKNPQQQGGKPSIVPLREPQAITYKRQPQVTVSVKKAEK